MFDLNQDSAQTRRFLFFIAMAPLIEKLIEQAEAKGGKGSEKRKAVVDGIGAGLATMEQFGYLPRGTVADLQARDMREVGKLTDATVASYNKTGVLEQKKHKEIAAQLERKDGESDADFQKRVDAEFARQQQEEQK